MTSKAKHGNWRQLDRALWRRLVTAGIKPTVSGETVFRDTRADQVRSSKIVYVQPTQSLADALIVEKAMEAIRNSAQSNWPNSPLEPLWDKRSRPQSLLALAKSVGGRITMRSAPALLRQLIDASKSEREHITLVPVCVYWGRTISPKDSFLRALTSEQRSATAGLRRLLGLIFDRGDVHVCFGNPVSLQQLAVHEKGADFAERRAARLLRMRFKAMHFVTLGPDHSHRRTLLSKIVRSTRVKKAIRAHDAAQATKKLGRKTRMQVRALKMAKTIASDLTYTTIRMWLIFLTWFWRRIYDGVRVNGLDAVRAINDTHTLVYVPTHRSHIDYLVLSYSLHIKGIMLPHVAAGDNLNLPVLGRLLRQGGAFFMRRSFRDNLLYTAVFEEYLYRVLSEGHSLEFFPEGGRSRSGHLLTPKYGLLKLCLEHQQQGLPKPLAFVPIYFGYEKVVEAGSYLRELRGSAKRKEKLLDVLGSLHVIRQNFGTLQVNVAPPIKLDQWLELEAVRDLPSQEQVISLGSSIMQSINHCASVNPVNLVALAITQRAQLTVQEAALLGEISSYLQIARSLYGEQVLTANVGDAANVIDQVRTLGFIQRHKEESWITCSSASATMLTWYRNNVLHLFAGPSLLALLISRSPLGLTLKHLTAQVDIIYPFIAKELTAKDDIYVPQLLAVLENLNLVVQKDGRIMPPLKTNESYAQLMQLSSLVLEMLQRMYVVISIARQAALDRNQLRTLSQSTARKLSRLFGLSGAEFSEERLFDAFIDTLVAKHYVVVDENQKFVASDLLHQVAEHAAQQVVDPQVHIALQRAIASGVARLAS